MNIRKRVSYDIFQLKRELFIFNTKSSREPLAFIEQDSDIF